MYSICSILSATLRTLIPIPIPIPIPIHQYYIHEVPSTPQAPMNAHSRKRTIETGFTQDLAEVKAKSRYIARYHE